jgi:alkaline phosphatase D
MAHQPVRGRRRILQAAAAAAAAVWLPQAARGEPSHDPFALGVASGSPTHDALVLWTRLIGPALAPLAGGPVAVRWELAQDEGFSRIVQRGEAMALPQLAHSVHVEVQGLAPDRWYWYRFLAGGAASRTGRTRTFPAPDAPAQRLRLAYASCQRWDHGYFGAYRHMREEEVDAVLFLGDSIYEYPAARGAVRVPPGGWVLTLDEYRQRHALHRTDPDLQAMHATCPWLVTWDDHEVQNDYAGQHAGYSGPPVADFLARRAAAYRAFYEHMPLRADVLTRALAGLAGGAELRLYSHARFGRLATIALLDDRQYRDAQACTRGGRPGSGTIDPAQCPAWSDPARTLLGAIQERWLDAQFARAGEQWNVIAQQTLFGRRELRAGAVRSLWNDGWDGYPAARGRLLDSLQRHRVANPVFLGGDMHENWVGHVLADAERPGSDAVGVEFCGTSITSRSSSTPDQVAAWLAANPHFVFADAQRRGYGVCEFTASRLTTTLRVVDDVTRPDPSIATLATFEVAAGRPRVERT